MRVAVVITVLNEADAARETLDALCRQSRPPDEVVVADGGSSDGTADVVRDYLARLPLSIVEAPGTNIAQGRNAAIRAATAEVVAVTDAGAWAEFDWLEKLTAPFEAGPGVQAVAGFFKADPRSAFEAALGATTLPDVADVQPAIYLPSSRSAAFRVQAWVSVGGYPEWLDYCEDVVFDQRLRARYGPFVLIPDAVVHFRPRADLSGFIRQYFAYARGDGKAGLFGRQHAVRYFAYLVVAPLLVMAALTVSPWLWALAALAGGAYLRRPYQRLGQHLAKLSTWGRIKAVGWVPVLRVVGDVAKMVGYPVGVGWRIWRPPNPLAG